MTYELQMYEPVPECDDSFLSITLTFEKENWPKVVEAAKRLISRSLESDLQLDLWFCPGGGDKNELICGWDRSHGNTVDSVAKEIGELIK